jgi:16S rRNA C967 or C1407 C5-methylase (RsmB/RsmF family)/NOL1/NOP2/fmu family ribosome biogenesis protein
MNRDPRARPDERVAASLDWLARYDEIVDDRAAFRAALDERPPVDLLVPAPFRRPEAVAATLAQRGLAVERCAWSPYHLRVATREGAGKLPEVVLGHAFPQGLSSALPPLALAPRPGERLLDLCAAPGGKTVMLAALAGQRAPLLAADRSHGRAGLLVQTLARMAVPNAVSVVQDAGSFPAGAPFDAILLDAPCTGEGTFRVPAPRYDPRGIDGLREAQGLQRRLLRRALALLGPGGRLVYSTCSLAPEEDEAVVEAALAERADVRLAPLPDDLPGQPGLDRWQAQRFRAPLHRTRRVFPHHTGSWGFFVALLEKDRASTAVATPRRPREPVVLADDREARRAAEEAYCERFGVRREVLDEMILLGRGRDVWAFAPAAPSLDLGPLSVVAPGLRLLHRTRRGARPTTAGLRWLGAELSERVVEVSMSEAAALIEAGELPAPAGAPGGMVALRVGGAVAGAGLVHDGRLELEIPRAWR